MIHLKFWGRLGDRYGMTATHPAAGLATVAELRRAMDGGENGDLLPLSVRAVVNGTVVLETHTLQPGDRVEFLPPVGGG